jgi:hypothetical protein
MTRAVSLFVVTAALAAAQNNGRIPTSTLSDLPWVKSGQVDLLVKPAHIHFSHQDCKKAPDGVYSKTNGIYYACIDHAEVCNKAPHSIPQRMIDAFDREMREFREKVARKQSESKQRIDAARAKDEAEWGPRRAADARMGEARRGNVRGSAVPIEAASTPLPQQAKIPDERVAEIAVGTGREELLRKFGQPHSRISGESERLTYLLISGASVKFEIEMGSVTNVRVVQ